MVNWNKNKINIWLSVIFKGNDYSIQYALCVSEWYFQCLRLDQFRVNAAPHELISSSSLSLGHLKYVFKNATYTNHFTKLVMKSFCNEKQLL